MTKQAIARRRAGRGFTLIEVMIVVGIIVVLGAIALAVGMQVKRSAAETATKTTLKALDLAMGAFLKDHPEPPDVPPNDTTWFPALQATGHLPKTLKIVGNNVQDGFGNNIHYIPANQIPFIGTTPYPGWTAKPNGIFWSYGPDGVPGPSSSGPGDDIFSEGASAQ
jgi:prepilin-type N-terminal cleavage/methylation domain-containing protein